MTFERVWRSSGINFAVLTVVTYIIRGTQPEIGASSDALAEFYSGDRSTYPDHVGPLRPQSPQSPVVRCSPGE